MGLAVGAHQVATRGVLPHGKPKAGKEVPSGLQCTDRDALVVFVATGHISTIASSRVRQVSPKRPVAHLGGKAGHVDVLVLLGGWRTWPTPPLHKVGHEKKP